MSLSWPVLVRQFQTAASSTEMRRRLQAGFASIRLRSLARLSYLNQTLKFTTEMAARNSPALLDYPRAAPLFLVLGEDESPGYHRQSEHVAAKWPALGYPCDYLVPRQLDHFASVDCLIDPGAELVRRQIEQMSR